jgi:hypothetical protein
MAKKRNSLTHLRILFRQGSEWTRILTKTPIIVLVEIPYMKTTMEVIEDIMMIGESHPWCRIEALTTITSTHHAR